MKNVLNLTNKYIVLATPLILFTLISSIYTAFSLRGGNIINFLIALVILTLMSAAFIAGWFNMVKLASTDAEPAEPSYIIKEFIPGVGEYFLTSIGIIFIVCVINLVIIALSFILGLHFIGDPGISADALSKAMSNAAALKAFIAGLSSEQLLKINLWNLLLLGMMGVVSFLLILYLPAVFFKSKNPFKAFFISLKDLFSRNFLACLGLYLLIFTVNFFISVFAAILAGTVITNFIMTLINFYFICVVSVGVFYFYNQKFVKQQIGKNIDVKI